MTDGPSGGILHVPDLYGAGFELRLGWPRLYFLTAATSPAMPPRVVACSCALVVASSPETVSFSRHAMVWHAVTRLCRGSACGERPQLCSARVSRPRLNARPKVNSFRRGSRRISADRSGSPLISESRIPNRWHRPEDGHLLGSVDWILGRGYRGGGLGSTRASSDVPTLAGGRAMTRWRLVVAMTVTVAGAVC